VHDWSQGLFCDIDTKRLYAVCGTASTAGDVAKNACFDVEAEELVELQGQEIVGGFRSLFSAPKERKVLKQVAPPLEMDD
jgi:hypothetical protein